MEDLNSLDKFGKFIMENCRDHGIEFSAGLLNNKWKSDHVQDVQTEISQLSENQKQALQKAFTIVLDVAIHNFLFALQDGFNDDIQILVDSKNLVNLSDGIHGEPYSDEGWQAKYSKFGGDYI
jgi:hypothetical protein